MFVAISVYKRCLVRLILQLFVGRLMSYLRYLCLIVYSGSTTYCIVLVLLFVFVLIMKVSSIYFVVCCSVCLRLKSCIW